MCWFYNGKSEGSGLWVAIVLPLLSRSVQRSIDDQGKAFLQGKDMTSTLDRVDETMGCVRLGRSTHDELNHCQKKGGENSKAKRLN